MQNEDILREDWKQSQKNHQSFKNIQKAIWKDGGYEYVE